MGKKYTLEEISAVMKEKKKDHPLKMGYLYADVLAVLSPLGKFGNWLDEYYYPMEPFFIQLEGDFQKPRPYKEWLSHIWGAVFPFRVG